MVEFTLKYIETQASADNKWFANNRQLHFNILNALSSRERTSSFQTDSFPKYVIIPNQVGQLCKVGDLNVLAGVEALQPVIKETLYDIYLKCNNTDLGLKLVDDDYALCCVELTDYSSADVDKITIHTILEHCYAHLDIGHKLSDLIEAIVNDDSDAETHIKIRDYRCDLNKGFFKSSPHIGIQDLVDDILSKASK